MISNPQEIEQTAMAIANWIVYNNRPFVFPADGGKQVYLTVLSEEQMRMLSPPVTDTEENIVTSEQNSE